ncbi:MAG: flagellar hook-associated protein FlgK [Magnetospirillum sp.]|nr:flagellar hook-associated protein FlgK [Magnetospirillum sp.]
MSLTLGLSTAISGMMTSQRGLDSIAQNVSNANTEGYTRKVMNQEARVLAGFGAGVQIASYTREVDEGILKHLRNESSTLGELSIGDDFFQRLSQLFGTPADNTSISHVVTTLQQNFETLATQVTKQTSYLGVVSSAQDATDLINTMSEQIQEMRVDADKRITDVVGFINTELGNVDTLNNLIVRNIATGSATQDLEDQRDVALNKLADYLDITYYRRNDGAMNVFTKDGSVLVDSEAKTLSHASLTFMQASSTSAGGNIDEIHLGAADLTGSIRSGELKGLIDVRDTVLADFQAGLDRMAFELKNRVNQAANRGTSYPTASNAMTGTRTFGDQDNETQRIRLAGTTGDDVMVTLFDADGVQIGVTGLDDIMTTAYGAGDAAAKGSRTAGTWWSVDEVAAHIQGFLNAANYTKNSAVSVALDSDGHLAIDVGNTTVSLAFRDQASDTVGDDRLDATIEFDVNGDGDVDETVDGFANFFGLNDMFVTESGRYLVESEIQPSTFATSVSRTIEFYDGTGLLGSSITVGAGSSLAEIAEQINAATRTWDSAVQSTTYTVSAAADAADQTISVVGPNGLIVTYQATATDTLSTIATYFTTNGGGSLDARVVDDGTGERLRITHTSGGDLAVSGALASDLGIIETQRLSASVVPEGAGYRLRLQQSEKSEVYFGATPDGAGKSLVTDLGLSHAATGTAEMLAVNPTLVDAPYRVARGAVQYDSDLGKYFINEGDNSTANDMAAALSDKGAVDQAGSMGEGNFSVAEYGAALISLASRQASANEGRFDYQTKLCQSIQSQHDNLAGVNVDEEITALISYQQAYSAAAKVIGTLQDMLQVLTNMIQ